MLLFGLWDSPRENINRTLSGFSDLGSETLEESQEGVAS